TELWVGLSGAAGFLVAFAIGRSALVRVKTRNCERKAQHEVRAGGALIARRRRASALAPRPHFRFPLHDGRLTTLSGQGTTRPRTCVAQRSSAALRSGSSSERL